MTNPTARRRAAILRGASATALIAMISSTAFAQDAPTEGAVDEVVITGSRTLRDGSAAPTPVTVMAIEQLNQASPRNVTEALAALPEFRASSSTNTASSSATNNTTGSYLNLRGLGPERTLVLLDGRRVAPGNTSNAVNFDLLPQPLIKRVDVVTGGASASYGSDAVAGVVNVILDKDFSGIKGLIQGGISDYGDVGSYKFELSTGGRYLDDRLHILASYGNRRSNPVYEQQQREWAAFNKPGRFVGGGFTNNILNDYRQSNTAGGVILASIPDNPANLRNLQFFPGGVVGPFNVGSPTSASAQIGGDGSANYVSLASLVESQSSFIRATYDVSENLNVYLQASVNSIHNRYEVTAQSVAQTTTAYTIFEGNPFIPPTIATLLAANAPSARCATLAGFLPDTVGGVATPLAQRASNPANQLRCFRMSRFNLDWGRLTGDIVSSSHDIVAGFESTIFGDWRFSGYYEHGENASRTFNENNLWFERAHAAADVIANPAVGGVPGVAAGAPICRARLYGTATAPNPTGYADCVPINMFGFGSPSPEAIAYVAPTSYFGNKARQDVFALDLAGEPFELPAGPVSFAVGAEYRTLYVAQYGGIPEQNPGRFTGPTAGVRGAPPSLVGVPGSFGFSNVTPFNGNSDVQELYTEIDVPLLRDVPFFQEFSVNAAGRYTNYSTTGEVKTWKVGTSWRINDNLRMRGTLSRDIRAPSPAELFATGSRFERPFNDPFNNNTPSTAFDVTMGNPDLKPEIADSLTAGLVFTPQWIPGLTVTVDYYEIEINDAITNLLAQASVDACFRGSAVVCATISRGPPTPENPAGPVTQFRNIPLNFAKVTTSGFDVEIGYRFELPALPGSFRTRTLLGFLQDYSNQAPGTAIVSQRGDLSAVDNPKLRGVFQLTYENGPVALYLQQNYISGGTYDRTLLQGVNINDNDIPSHSTTDVTGRYKFGADQQYEAFLTVNNLFNRDPVLIGAGSATTTFATNNSLYDTIGRYYTTGLRFRF